LSVSISVNTRVSVKQVPRSRLSGMKTVSRARAPAGVASERAHILQPPSQPSLAFECPIKLGGHVGDVLWRPRARSHEQKLFRALPRLLLPPTLRQRMDEVTGVG